MSMSEKMSADKAVKTKSNKSDGDNAKNMVDTKERKRKLELLHGGTSARTR
jgi:hypothetical protein